MTEWDPTSTETHVSHTSLLRSGTQTYDRRECSLNVAATDCRHYYQPRLEDELVSRRHITFYWHALLWEKATKKDGFGSVQHRMLKNKNNLGKQGFRINLSQFSNFLDWESILCWISLLSVKKYSGWRKKISCLSGLVHVLDIPIKLNTYPKW